eukprot:CAMPEP_0195089316 /NCGR_PEP_ID=MMETSP0448-20130528/28633_1 /TAXON_ID=66468 /ORGANISM="Heterocapsa triquestra, Strain CCMP 448" /LENGTH=275 /DNA_ID=CAMNT_0040123039 /DNA_START=10 /DNA_END=837 /DNA_ORIENTATION=+
MAWLARLLHWHDLCWPTTRLLLLAAREERDRDTLPRGSLGLLPADLIEGRILSYLLPPRAPAVEGVFMAQARPKPPRILARARPSSAPAQPLRMAAGYPDSQLGAEPQRERGSPKGSSVVPDPVGNIAGEERDVIAVLAHFIMFAPPSIWPRLSAFGFALAETVLANLSACQEREVYLAASVLATLAQRIEEGASIEAAARHGTGPCCEEEMRRRREEDFGPLRRLSGLLCAAADARITQLSPFVDGRCKDAVERVLRAQEGHRLHRSELDAVRA